MLDPTGTFLVVPDLGADLVRVWNVDPKTLDLTPSTPLSAANGSGPRHVAFLKTESKTFMYLTSELANTVTVYEVTYRCDGTLGFGQVFITNTHGDNSTLPSNITAAEVHLSVSPLSFPSLPQPSLFSRAPITWCMLTDNKKLKPDNKFLLVTSRGETNSPNPGDPLITFAVDGRTGALAHVQTVGTGGLVPRQFSVNKAGTLVAVGTQGDGRVTVFERDLVTGMLTGPVADVAIEGGQVTCVVFDE